MFKGICLLIILIGFSACHERPAVYSKAQVRGHFYEHESAFKALGEAVSEIDFELDQYACAEPRKNFDPEFTNAEHIDDEIELAPYLEALKFPGGVECIVRKSINDFWIRDIHSGNSREYSIMFSYLYALSHPDEIKACGEEDNTKIYSYCVTELKHGWYIYQWGIHDRLFEQESLLKLECYDSGKSYIECEREADKRLEKMMAD